MSPAVSYTSLMTSMYTSSSASSTSTVTTSNTYISNVTPEPTLSAELSTESQETILERKITTFKATIAELKEQVEEIQDIVEEVSKTIAILKNITTLRSQRKEVRKCQDFIVALKRVSNNILNAEKQVFICLQNEAENVSCNSTEKRGISDQMKVIENENVEAIQFLNNKRDDLNETKNELEEIETDLSP